MKKSIIFLTAYALLLLSSCKTDHIIFTAESYIIKSGNPISQTKTAQLKKWYESHRKNTSGTHSRDEYSLYPPIILWESGVFIPTDNAYIFRIQYSEKGEINANNFFSVYLNEDGDIATGEYIFTQTPEETSGMTLTEAWVRLVKVFEEEDIPLNFEASMIKYGLDGERIFSKHIENQVITNTDEKVKSVERAPVYLPDEGIEICIDSWWVTWEPGTGIIIGIQLMGSQCSIYGGPGGSGGGNSSQCYTPEQAVFIIENSTSTNVNEWTYENGISYDDGLKIRQPRNASFKFATINLAINPYEQPSYSAMFTGIRYKIIPPNSDPWKWETFTYDQTVQSGGQIPMCSNVQMSATVSSFIATDRKQALIAVDYTAIVSATCNAINQSNNTQVGLPIVKTVTGIARPY